MNDEKQKTRFLLGNAVLAVALLVLVFLDPLSEALGSMAMGLWIGLVGVGVYLLSTGKGGGPMSPHGD